MKGQVDGFIIAPSLEATCRLKQLKSRGYLMYWLTGTFLKLIQGYVVINNFAAAKLATEHLIKQGVKNIAFITASDSLNTMNERKKGYLKALSEANLSIDERLICDLKFIHD